MSKSKQQFVWTDDLVKEFVRWNFNRQNHNYLPSAMEEFKNLKQKAIYDSFIEEGILPIKSITSERPPK